jgi:hypothetical protein
MSIRSSKYRAAALSQDALAAKDGCATGDLADGWDDEASGEPARGDAALAPHKASTTMVGPNITWVFPFAFLSIIGAGCLSALSFRAIVLQALFIVVLARTTR